MGQSNAPKRLFDRPGLSTFWRNDNNCEVQARTGIEHVTGCVSSRPHQEDFGKGISRVFFSGIYPYSRDTSVQVPYPYSVNDQLPDTRQSGSRRVSKSITRTLDFEESDTLDSLLNGNFCHKSMRGKLQRGSVWAKWPTSHILRILERVAAHRPSSWALRRPSSEKSALSLPPSGLPSWPTTRHCGGRPHTAPICLACQVNHAQSVALPPRVPIEPRTGVVERAHGSDCRPDGPTDGALSGSGSDGMSAP